MARMATDGSAAAPGRPSEEDRVNRAAARREPAFTAFVIYDRTFFIALERRKTRAAALDFLARHQDEPARLPVVVWGEIAAGYDSLDELRSNLDPAYTIESLTGEIAWHASRVQVILAQRGQLVGENDTWIAGYALYFDEPLVSRDTDYQKIVSAGIPLRLLGF